MKVSIANGNFDTEFRKNLKVIEEDLFRTFSELSIFYHGTKLYQPLKNVLLAYSLMRPEIGYVQGMSYVAATILLHYSKGDECSEYQTFYVLANVINNSQLLTNFLNFRMDNVNKTFDLFLRLLELKVPRLHHAFTQCGLSCSIFLFEWVVAAYTNVFQLDLVSRIWDNFLFLGDFHILKTAIAICHVIQDKSERGSRNTFENLVMLVKNVKQFVSEDALFESLKAINLSYAEYQEIYK